MIQKMRLLFFFFKFVWLNFVCAGHLFRLFFLFYLIISNIIKVELYFKLFTDKRKSLVF